MILLTSPWSGMSPGRMDGLSKYDSRIWRAYHADHYADWVSCRYNVPLDWDPVSSYADMYGADAQAAWLQYARRIDVLVDAGTKWIIVECRHHASAEAVGRLLLYSDIWDADPPDDRPVELMLLSDEMVRGIDILCAQHDIIYVVMEDI